MKKNTAALVTETTDMILSGGRRTTAASVRFILNDIFESFPNLVDGGFTFDSPVGYSQTVSLANPLAFAPVGFVNNITVGLLPKAGAVPMEGNLNMDSYGIINLYSIKDPANKLFTTLLDRTFYDANGTAIIDINDASLGLGIYDISGFENWIKGSGSNETFLLPNKAGAGGTIALLSDLTSGTVSSVSIVTANGFSGSVATATTTPAITLTLQNSTTSQSGQLTATDWNTFNNKQTALSGTGFVKISGTTISYDNSTYLTSISGIAAGGDLSGTYANPSVSKIKGNTVPVDAIGFLKNDGAGNLTWASAGTGTVTSVSGTTNRITSTGGATPVIDISASYVGQSSITTVGTINTGVWQGTAITNSFIQNYTLTANTQILTGSNDLQTILNSLKGSDNLARKEVGTVLYNAFLTAGELSSYTNTGSATFAFSSGKLSVSGGASNYSNFFTSSYITLLNKYDLGIEFTSTVAGTGLAIGFLNLHIRVDTSAGANRGLLYIENSTSGTPTTIATSATALTYTDTTDTLRLSFRRVFQTVFAKVENLTTPSNAPVYLQYKCTLVSGQPTLQAISNPAIYAYGGTQLVSKFEYINKEIQNCDLLVMGDSNSEGWYQGATPWFRVLQSNFPGYIAIQARQGATAVNLSNAIAETIAINPKAVLLNIGTNNAAAGDTLVVFRPKYALIVKQLKDAGIKVIIHAAIIPNATTATNNLVVSYNGDTNSIYGALDSFIDTFTAQATGGLFNAVFNDGTHMKDKGGVNFANTVMRGLNAAGVVPASDVFNNTLIFGTTAWYSSAGTIAINFAGSPGAETYSFFSKINNGAGSSIFTIQNNATGAGEMMYAVYNAANNSTNNRVTARSIMNNSAGSATVNGYTWFKTEVVTAGSEATSFGIDNTIANVRRNVFLVNQNTVAVMAGLATSFAKVGGSIFSHFADAGTPASTTETDLYSDTTIANTLSVSGDTFESKYALQLTSTGGATKQVRVYFAGTLIYDSTAISVLAASDLQIEVVIVRTGSSTAIATVKIIAPSALISAPIKITSLTGLNFATTNILKITGQAGAGAAANDVLAKIGLLYWKPSA